MSLLRERRAGSGRDRVLGKTFHHAYSLFVVCCCSVIGGVLSLPASQGFLYKGLEVKMF